jgi:hypothetical protein
MVTNTAYNLFLSKLKRYRRRIKTYAVLEGMLRLLGWAGITVSLAVILESLFHLPPGHRTVLSGLLIAIVSVLTIFLLFRPLWNLLVQRHHPSLNRIAFQVGLYYQNVQDRLANALQLFERQENPHSRYSIQLIAAALEGMAQRLKQESFTSLIDRRPIFRSLRIAGFGLVLLVVTGGGFVPVTDNAVNRLIHFRTEFSQTPLLIFSITPGDTSVVKGSDLSIRGSVSDPEITHVVFHQYQYSRENRTRVASNGGRFDIQLSSLQDSLEYYFSAGSETSPRYWIDVFDRPMVNRLQLQIFPPDYSRVPPFELEENIGDVSALKGSRIAIRGKTNKALQLAKVVFESGRETSLATLDSSFQGTFTLSNDDIYNIRLKDRHETVNAHPIDYHLQVIPDQKPIVKLVRPGRDVDLGEDMQIPLEIKARDDYGVSRLELGFQHLSQGQGEFNLNQFRYQPLTGFQPGTQVDMDKLWNLEDMNLFPKDVVYYHVRAYDSDTISGPKVATSQVYRIRFPSIYEIYREVAYEQENVLQQMESVYEQGKENRSRVEQLARELKRSQTQVDWQKKQEVKETVEQGESQEEQLSGLSQKLDTLVEQMERHQLLSEETLQKYDQLQELVQDIMTPELRQTLREMKDAIEQVDKEQLQEAMETLKRDEKEFQRNLDRAISLFKRLRMEQKLDQSIKMTQNLETRQRQLEEKAENDGMQEESVQWEQETIQEDSKQLDSLLTELGQEMQDDPSMPQAELSDAQNDMQQITQELSELVQQARQNQAESYKATSQKTRSRLEQMKTKLERAKDKVTGEQNRKAQLAMKRGMRDLLQLSHHQEQTSKALRNAPTNGPHLSELADQQNNLASGLERVMNQLFNASRNSFRIQPQLAKSMAGAHQAMETVLENMSERNYGKARQAQQTALSGLNAAIYQMMQSMNQQGMGNQGGMSFENFMQQMQKLSQSQQSINQQTRGLQQGLSKSMAQQAAMSRLMREQRGLRKALEQLAREAQSMSNILGDLGQIGKDMKDVEEDLANRQVTPETLQRQQRILSRMLDAQRSIHQREYSRQRQAETADGFVRPPSPGEFSLTSDKPGQLEEDLLRAKRQGFSRDYLDLIKRYYEAISNSNETQSTNK